MPPNFDRLGESADPLNYVPILSSERALDALHENLRAGCSRVSLQGPSGIGKSLLLRVLAARELRRARRVIFSPFLHMAADDVALWLLHLLGRPALGAGTRDDQLLSEIAARGTHAMLVIIDEFQSTTLASAQRLSELAAAAHGGLVLVTGERPGRELDGLRSAFLPEATVSLRAPFPAHEMRTLCDALLLESAGELARRLDGAEERDRVVQQARGIPGLLTPEILGWAKDDWVRCGIAAGRCAGSPYPTVEIDAGRTCPTELVPFEAPATRSEPSAPAAIAPTPRRATARLAAGISTAVQCARAVASFVPMARHRLEQVVRIAASALQGRAMRGIEVTLEGARRAGRTLSKHTAAALLSAISRVQGIASRWQGHRVRITRAAIRTAGPARIAASALRGRAMRGIEVTLEDARRAGRTLSKHTAAALLSAISRVQGIASRWQGNRVRITRAAIRTVSPALIAAVLLALIAWRYSTGIEDPVGREAAPVHAANAPIRVQVNARPWAVIHVDGIDVGPTPLSHLQLLPGPHEFEANFADGRSVRRRVEISSEQRSVSLR
jgi:hypothetical protein